MPLPLTLSALPPWSAHLCLRVEAFLRAQVPELPRGARLVAGLSGGLDSSALVYILSLLANRLEVLVVACHLDHGLRPDSALDARQAQALCEELDVPCVTRLQDVAALAEALGTGLEDAGRRARYAFFEEVRARCGAFAVLTAHQRNDLAEDVLMRLTRGAGWPALSGMRAHDPGRRLLRPLLETPRAALERLAAETGLAWREDPSNADPAYFRNRVRRDILPHFLRENPDFLRAAAELHRQGEIDRDYWQATMDQAFADWPAPGQPVLLPAEGLGAWPQALRLRLYRRAVTSLGPGQALASGLHALDRAWTGRQTGKILQFPGPKEAQVLRQGLIFRVATLPERR